MRYARIKNKGNFLGLKGPAEKLQISDAQFILARRFGAQIEWYEETSNTGINKVKIVNSEQEAREKEIKKQREKEKVIEVLKSEEPVEDINEILEPTVVISINDEISDIDSQIEARISDMNVEEYFEKDYSMLISEDGEVNLTAPNYDLTEKIDNTYYSEEDLLDMTRKEMMSILLARGFTSRLSPYRGKSTDSRQDLTEKILATQEQIEEELEPVEIPEICLDEQEELLLRAIDIVDSNEITNVVNDEVSHSDDVFSEDYDNLTEEHVETEKLVHVYSDDIEFIDNSEISTLEETEELEPIELHEESEGDFEELEDISDINFSELEKVELSEEDTLEAQSLLSRLTLKPKVVTEEIDEDIYGDE